METAVSTFILNLEKSLQLISDFPVELSMPSRDTVTLRRVTMILCLDSTHCQPALSEVRWQFFLPSGTESEDSPLHCDRTPGAAATTRPYRPILDHVTRLWSRCHEPTMRSYLTMEWHCATILLPVLEHSENELLSVQKQHLICTRPPRS